MKRMLQTFFILLLLAEPVLAEANLYTLSHYPIPNNNDLEQIFQLDEIQLLEQRLSHTLSANPKQAVIEAKQLIKNGSIDKHDPQWLNAITGLTKAWALGIEKVPAVVFDDHYVVYGTTDIALASKKFAEFKAEKER
jgi:integrating conjugative element protein (TIGR03757 family)